MNLVMIGLIAFTIFCLMSRGERQRDTSGAKMARTRKETEQIERLKARVAVLEEILLDRDRRLRDGFRGL